MQGEGRLHSKILPLSEGLPCHKFNDNRNEPFQNSDPGYRLLPAYFQKDGRLRIPVPNTWEQAGRYCFHR